jgi:3-dehydroquinate dehydratase-2
MKKMLLINGPNLNLLGLREPQIYGIETIKDLEENVVQFAKKNGVEVSCIQSNHEGVIIDMLHEANGNFEGIILNPGAFTHYSYAIRDAIASIQVPVVEVHISNVHAREEFRRISVISPVTAGQIVGLGFLGYNLAVLALLEKTGGK